MPKSSSRHDGRDPHDAAQVLHWTPTSWIEAIDRTGCAPRSPQGVEDTCSSFTMSQKQAAVARLQQFAAGWSGTFPGASVFSACRCRRRRELNEIHHAFDTLHASGVAFMSNYGRVWPGHPNRPVLRRARPPQAVVYVHPILPEACRDMMPGVVESALEICSTPRARSQALSTTVRCCARRTSVSSSAFGRRHAAFASA